MISSGQPTISRKEILEQVSEADILGYYLGITNIPTLINSPLRIDKKASFCLYSPNGSDVNYIDFSTKDTGGCMSLLMQIWNCSRSEVYKRIQKDLLNMTKINCSKGNYTQRGVVIHGKAEIQSVAREWRDYDEKYWASFGIPIKVLEWAGVHPISHKIIIKDGKTSRFAADKYAYTFVEMKEGRVTQKLYQPFNKNGYKWQNSHDKSVLGLWSKMPEKGKAVCICSSVKDALCLMVNLKIPCICLQGEGYPISDTAIRVLRERFTDIYLCLDNDKAGVEDAYKLTTQHNLINVTIPQFNEGKDISDFFKAKGKEEFQRVFKKIFTDAYYDYYNELPF